MTTSTHHQFATFIWSICNLLRGPYKRNEYRKVILPLTVLRRFDCLLEPTKEKVLAEYKTVKGKPETVIQHKLQQVTKRPFYNTSKMDIAKLLDDPNQIAANLSSYIKGFSPNVRSIFERFAFEEQITRMAEKNLLFQVLQKFSTVDLSPDKVSNLQMGYIFEELIRIGAEQSNEEAGEHFTPREVIRLMVNLLLAPEADLAKSHVVKTIYDPACGTGGMLSVAEGYIRELNKEAKPTLYGQDWNDEAWAVCKSDMLIKGEDAENIILGDTFTQDGFKLREDGSRWTFDYMLANPPFGVEWKQQQKFIEKEHDNLGYDGRFGAGTPRINDGSLLFLQHMISKMRPVSDGGSRIAIVFNGSPLFSGDAGSGESEIRRWILDNDWLEAIVALPEQLFYNTGIATYIWVLSNRKPKERKGKVQLINALDLYLKMRKALGEKKNELSDDQIDLITKIYSDFKNNGISKIFDNEDFLYRQVTVESPLRLCFQVSQDRIENLKAGQLSSLAIKGSKKEAKASKKAVSKVDSQQDQVIKVLESLAGRQTFTDRQEFISEIEQAFQSHGLSLSAPIRKMMLSAFGYFDERGSVCRNADGEPEPDSKRRDFENIPYKEPVQAFFDREVKPYKPDAWVDEEKTRIGSEILFSRYFYKVQEPRALDKLESEIKSIEREIAEMLAEVIG